MWTILRKENGRVKEKLKEGALIIEKLGVFGLERHWSERIQVG